jgi:hypothetical protein
MIQTVARPTRENDMRFTRYIKTILPHEGYVFWVRDRLPLSAAPPLEVEGILEVVNDSKGVVFIAESEVEEFNLIGPTVIFVCEHDGRKYAFCRAPRAGIVFGNSYAYVGDEIYPAMASQLIDDFSQLPAPLGQEERKALLPIWLAMNKPCHDDSEGGHTD